MRLAFATLLVIGICARAQAEDTPLRDLLSLLGRLKMGSSYETVKGRLPRPFASETGRWRGQY